MFGWVIFFEAQTVEQPFYGIFININIYKVLQDKKKQKRENKAIGSTNSSSRELWWKKELLTWQDNQRSSSWTLLSTYSWSCELIIEDQN